MDGGFRAQALYVLRVCGHLVCRFVEQVSVEEDLLLVALTPLQMSHSFLPSLL